MLESIILHVGATKTGTSSIQSGLARARGDLLKAGYLYPESKVDKKAIEGRVTGGNVDALATFLQWREKHPRIASARLDTYLRSLPHLQETRHLIFSGERLGPISEADAQAIVEVLGRHANAVKVHVYLRHVAGHAYSQYNEFVKRRGYTKNFDNFAKNRYVAPYEKILTAWESAVPASSIHVSLYDEFRQTLFKHFLSQIGCDAAIQNPSRDVVNRSLTDDEVALMRHLNTLDANRTFLAQIAEDALFNTHKPSSHRAISTFAFEHLRLKHEESLARLNARYLPTAPVQIESDDVEVVKGPLKPVDIPTDTAIRFLESSIRVSNLRDKKNAGKILPKMKMAAGILPAKKPTKIRRNGKAIVDSLSGCVSSNADRAASHHRLHPRVARFLNKFLSMR